MRGRSGLAGLANLVLMGLVATPAVGCGMTEVATGENIGGSAGAHGDSGDNLCSIPSIPTAKVVECTGATIGQTVWAKGCCYAPSSLTVAVGGTIEFKLADHEQVHTATAGPPGCIGEWDIRAPGGCLEMLKSGTYPFHCENHAGMTGSIVVE